MSNQTQKQGDHVQSLARGLLVLKTFSADYPVLTVAEAARLTGLARATVRRSLHTLQELGYVVADGRQFELTPKVLDLGFAYLHSAHIGDITQPYIESLSEKINESVSVAVLDVFDIVYIARVPTKRIMRIGLSLGSRLPALVTSMGRMIVADLPEQERRTFVQTAPIPKMTPKTLTNRVELQKVLAKAHERGWVLLDQELEDGVRSIAAPIRDRRNRTIAAINIGTQSGRISTKQLSEDFLPLLVATAADISSALSRH